MVLDRQRGAILITQFWRFCLISLLLCSTGTGHAAEKLGDWLEVVRNSSYASTKGFYQNISVIRRWVLLGTGYCEQQERHILFNRRGRFLGYMENAEDTVATQLKLNRLREQYADEGRVRYWVPGSATDTGYPFALACEQPFVDLEAARNRMLGKDKNDLVWGTWDGMSVGTVESPLPLTAVIDSVYNQRNLTGELEWSKTLLDHLKGQILIESGARKVSYSAASAIGLLQLRPEVLRDCQIPEKFYLHRMAQLDCALKLYRQNARNLHPVFSSRFSHLPTAKQDTLYAMLLVQAYHGGVGRIMQLLGDGPLGAASRYYADNQAQYRAEDIALGMIFHNTGKHGLGLASVYYLIDVEIATESLCQADRTLQKQGCAP